jgi:1,4-alpha-glucan branching enzyme
MTSSSFNNPGTLLHLSDDMRRIAEARHHDPFSVLGRHQHGDDWIIRVFNPHAEHIELVADTADYDGPVDFQRITNSDFFVLQTQAIGDYRLRWLDGDGHQHLTEDVYRFAPTLTDHDLYLFNHGDHRRLYDMLGAQPLTLDEKPGTRFAVWAPAAKRVSVVGNFNQWDGRTHALRNRGSSGVWEIFIPDLGHDELYKLEILGADDYIRVKQDPFANAIEMRPDTACRIYHSRFSWSDDQWVAQRQHRNWLHDPASIYEVHLGSWQRSENGEFLNYRTLAHKLVEYVQYLGYTHIELMPVTEHPLDDSWGYQVTGYFAATSRFGTPDDLKYFIDHCHQHNIGVILDWVPAHFPKDDYSLARFDGTCLFEHEDPRRGEHRDWGTLIFNYGRNEVRNFLIASALYWLREFHIDGLRVDAVASMLYLDYSREPDDWVPNEHGGRENLEAIEFLRHLNSVTQTEVPGSVIIAEESTSWPQVTRPPESGGLGFSMKWNMGWMHDTLTYMANDPVHRQFHHNQLTFGLLYLFTENFVLPFSHDEVVHGKGSMINKMPGDSWQQFANLRLLYSYQYTYPGKKLLFQGGEFAQRGEWNFKTALDWPCVDTKEHRGIMTLIADLNRLYREKPGLHFNDFGEGFEWINADDAKQSVISYLRKAGDRQLIVILNFTPVPREDYSIGVDVEGAYREIFNSDSECYGGTNVGNSGICETKRIPIMGRQFTITLTLPPLGVLILEHQSHD